MATGTGLRKARAGATRRRILDAAYLLFCSHGYVPTTMDAIAGKAGVAVQTVYFAFHTKAELMMQLITATAGGHEAEVPVPARAWMAEVRTTEDGRRALGLVVEHGVDIYARVAPLSPAVRAAAGVDEDVRAFWEEVAKARQVAMRRIVVRLDKLGQLQPGLTVGDGADVLAAIQSHETFLALVTERNWPIGHYKAWVYRTLCRTLLSDDAIRRAGEPVDGLSYANELAGGEI